MGPKYNQKFWREWLSHEKLKPSVAQDEKDNTKGFCKYCRCSLSTKLYDLLSHAETRKHKAAASVRGSCWKNLEFVLNENIVDNVKTQEAALALFICQHTSNNSIDHLSDLCKKQFAGADKIRLHRTKCAAIIKNILAPHFVKELREDISASKYSILVDESTDVGIAKLLGVVIIYFSTRKRQIVSTFLSLAEVTDTTAEGITRVILEVLNKFNLELQNLLGIGTDNATVMVGNKKSVYTELKIYVPSLMLIICVCHSVQLAVTHSWKQSMPSCLEYLINETYNWFSRSYIRQQSYKHIFEAINDGEDPLKLTNICDTRWLSIEVSIADQWIELKTHFGIAKQYEKCFMAQNLYDLYNEINLCYLIFLRPILTRVQILNKSFQSQNCDRTTLLSDMKLTINFLKQFVVQPTVEIDIITSDFQQHLCFDSYLGYAFESHVKCFKVQKVVNEEVEIDIRNSCIQFVINLIVELKKKDSAGNNPFKELVQFAINVLSLPWSNANVERVFSQLNIVKTKLRNRLMTDSVNAILDVRYDLKLNKCCFNYDVPKSVLAKIRTNSTYEGANVEDCLHIFS